MKRGMMLAMGLMLSAIVIAPAMATIVVSDTFTLTETRTAGSKLVGQTTEVGGLTWMGETTAGYRYYKLSDNGEAVFDNTSTSMQDRVASVPYTIAPEGEIVTLQADFIWTEAGTPESGSFAGIAFMRAAATPDIAPYMMLWQENCVGFRVYQTGFYQLMGDKTESSTAFKWIEANLPEALPLNENITIKLQYNSFSGAMSCWIADTQVITDYVPDPVTYAATIFTSEEIGWASFEIQEGKPTLCDNFAIDTVVPEPMTLALLALGGGVMLWRRK